MKIKADFHIHTHYSPDSGSSASGIVARARQLGLDVIGVTDHNTTKGAIEVRNLAKGKPLVLIGQEVKTLSGEIIVFGPEKDIPKKMLLRDTCRMAKTMDGFIVVPHAFDRTRNGLGRDILSVMDYIDAIEVLNSRCLRGSPNRKALAFAKEHEMPVVSGSDAHFPEEIGCSFTELEVEGKLTEKAVLDAVASGKAVVSGRRSGVKPHIRTALRRLKK
jgi:predicted metal-dependent phosphoesterase TrpH